jgi:hypothetical protein
MYRQVWGIGGQMFKIECDRCKELSKVKNLSKGCLIDLKELEKLQSQPCTCEDKFKSLVKEAIEEYREGVDNVRIAPESENDEISIGDKVIVIETHPDFERDLEKGACGEVVCFYNPETNRGAIGVIFDGKAGVFMLRENEIELVKKGKEI